MNEAEEGGVKHLFQILLKGPPTPRANPSRVDRCFPWWLRISVIGVAILLGLMWNKTALEEQFAGALQYGGLIAISLAVSFWWWFFIFNFGIALLWLLWPVRNDPSSSENSTILSILTFINRQIGHAEVLLVWIVVALVSVDRVLWQLVLLCTVLLLGEPIINCIASWRTSHGNPSAMDLWWRRRPYFYLATFLGIVLLALLAPKQSLKLVPGVLALTAADLVRYIRHRRWTRAMAQEGGEGPRTSHHHKQVEWARQRDAFWGQGVIISFLVLVLTASALGRRAYDKSLGTAHRGEPVDYCSVMYPPAPMPDLTMFLVSDSQFRALEGKRFVGQRPFADALVPVALRPVELDILSAASLWHFGSVYQYLAQRRHEKTFWAHLGDLADLSCLHEMDRSNRLLKAQFDPMSFAGVAPGNHDKAFTGNFYWSPYWDSACHREQQKISGRMEKPDSDRELFHNWQESLVRSGGRMRIVPMTNPIARTTQRGSALVTVTPLGRVRQDPQDSGTLRGVLGVFLDTSDGLAFDFGIAGLHGTFSKEQSQTVDDLIQEVRQAAGNEFQNPLYLVFLHHPFRDVIWRSSQRLRDWLVKLDHNSSGDPRLLAIISAHTHQARKDVHCLGKRMIPEFVVGSTTDPPQEGAVLYLGPGIDDILHLRVQTIPSVGRPGMTCRTDAPIISARDCQRVMARLRVHPACKSLFQSQYSSQRECSDFNQPLEVEGRLQQAIRWAGPGDETEILADQTLRVKNLWTCVCRDNNCTVADDAKLLDDELNFQQILSQLNQRGERETELTCLAWAAAAVQKHKVAGMTFADALRCSYDDDSVPPAQDLIARIEVTSCR